MEARIQSTARQMGAEAGRAAASWYEVTEANAAAILRGIEDGDPAMLDTFPVCDLSGEWADEPSGPRVYGDVYEAAGIPADDAECEDLHDVLDAYADGFHTAAHDELERRARAMLDAA